MLTGRIFVTGGSGSFGGALLAEVERNNWPCELVVYSNDEAAHVQLSRQYKRHEFVLGDIRDRDWMACKMAGCDAVIHAAAFKGVPMVERYPIEAIKTNVQGSINVAIAADRAGIPAMVALSTDKACEPVNVYGYTKALMEAAIMNAQTWAKNTRFGVVRLGNFIGSRGSVIPLFLSQRDVLTVTNLHMTRFWMTLEDAVRWVKIALTIGGGCIIAPKLKAMGIIDVAQCVSPGARVVEIGMRPGEKLHELMVGRSELDRACVRDGHFTIYPVGTSDVQGIKGVYSSEDAPRWTKQDMRRTIENWKTTRQSSL